MPTPWMQVAWAMHHPPWLLIGQRAPSPSTPVQPCVGQQVVGPSMFRRLWMQGQLVAHEAPKAIATHELPNCIIANETPKETCNNNVPLLFSLAKVESVQRAYQRDCKKFEDVAYEVHKAVGEKPSQVKVKVGGD